MKKLLLFIALASWCSAATHYYLDSSVGSSGVGTSWGTAFKAISNVPSLGPDDILEISGGSTGNTQNYAVPASPGYWNAGTGTAGHPFTIQIGQDASHNGIANFTPAAFQLLSGPTYFTFSGKYLTGADGIKHFKTDSTFSGNQIVSNCNHCHLEYIDASAGCLGFGDFSVPIGCEVNNVTIVNVDLGGNTNDHGIRFLGCGGAGGSTYGDGMNFHDSTIQVYRLAGGDGNDGVQATGTGYTVHDVTVTGVFNAGYPHPGQHQDGVQDTGGSANVEIYRNTFININNSAVFLDGVNGGFNNFHIYDNRCIISDSAVAAQTPSGVAMGVDGSPSGPNPQVWSNGVICNNTFINYGTGAGATNCMGLSNSSAGGAWGMTITNWLMENNLMVDGATSVGYAGPSTGTPTISNNVFVTNATAAGGNVFVTYAQYGGLSNNYSVKSITSPQYHTGNNIQATLSFTDFVGTAWNNPPSVGHLEYTASATPARVSSTVNSAGSTVTLLLDQSCTTGVGGNGGYTISASGGACTLTYSSGSGSSSYVFTTGRTINSGETITDSYTQPGNGIEATTGGADLASFSSQTVTNNSAQGGGSTSSSVISGKVVLSGKAQIK